MKRIEASPITPRPRNLSRLAGRWVRCSSVAQGDLSHTVASQLWNCLRVLLLSLLAILSLPASTSGLITIEALSYAFGEEKVSGSTVRLEIRRQGGLDQSATVDFRTLENGTATPQADFVPKAGTIRFLPEEEYQFVEVEILNDGLVEGRETVRFELSHASAGAVIGKAVGSSAIDDDEIPASLDWNFRPVYAGTPTVQLTGKILIANPTGTSRIPPPFGSGWPTSLGVVRLNSDGSVDPDFHVCRYRMSGEGIFQAVLASNGKILVKGPFDKIDGVSRPGLAQLLENGRLDSTFVPAAGDASVIIPGRDGGCLLLQEGHGLVSLRADGSIDEPFRRNFAAHPEPLREHIGELLEQEDGKILCLAYDVPDISLIRLNADGSLDSAFVPIRGATDILPLEGGKIGVMNSEGLVWLNAQGTIEAAFVYDAKPPPSPQLQVSGKLYGSEVIFNYGTRTVVYRWNAEGTRDPDFEVPWFQGNDTLSSGTRVFLERHLDGLLCSGFFVHASGLAVPGLVRILLDNAPRRAFAWSGGTRYQRIEGWESESAVELSLVRLGDTSAPGTIDFATLDGSAQAGNNYVATQGTVRFEPFEVEKRLRIPLIDNALFQGAPAFSIALNNPSDPAAALPPPVSVPIYDDDAGIVSESVRMTVEGSFQFTLCLPARKGHVLERSSDLHTWVPIPGTNDDGPGFVLREDRPEGPGPWFYRAKQR